MASDGVTAVANALNAAIYASAEARKQETGSSPLERIRQLNNATAERLRSRTLLDSAEGIRLACQAMHLTMEAAEAATGEFVTNAAALGLSWEKGAVAANAWYLNIYAPGHPFKGRLIGRIDWAQPGRDTAAADTITITICRFFGGSRSTDVLKEREYAPFITEADEIVWCDDKVRSDAATVIHGLHSDFAMQLEQDLDFESDQRHS